MSWEYTLGIQEDKEVLEELAVVWELLGAQGLLMEMAKMISWLQECWAGITYNRRRKLY
jgi:hypothetical protein